MGTYIVQKENADSHCVYEKEDVENAAVKMYLYHTSNDGGDQWIIGAKFMAQNIINQSDLILYHSRNHTWWPFRPPLRE
jgi:hypothetical protein